MQLPSIGLQLHVSQYKFEFILLLISFYLVLLCMVHEGQQIHVCTFSMGQNLLCVVSYNLVLLLLYSPTEQLINIVLLEVTSPEGRRTNSWRLAILKHNHFFL